jgi:hypothetical protein
MIVESITASPPVDPHGVDYFTCQHCERVSGVRLRCCHECKTGFCSRRCFRAHRRLSNCEAVSEWPPLLPLTWVQLKALDGLPFECGELVVRVMFRLPHHRYPDFLCKDRDGRIKTLQIRATVPESHGLWNLRMGAILRWQFPTWSVVPRFMLYGVGGCVIYTDDLPYVTVEY